MIVAVRSFVEGAVTKAPFFRRKAEMAMSLLGGIVNLRLQEESCLPRLDVLS